MPEELCAGVNTLGITGCRVLMVLERQGGGRHGDTHLHCRTVESIGLCAEVRDGRDVRERLGWTWGTAGSDCQGLGGILWCMGSGGTRPGEREYVCVCPQ